LEQKKKEEEVRGVKSKRNELAIRIGGNVHSEQHGDHRRKGKKSGKEIQSNDLKGNQPGTLPSAELPREVYKGTERKRIKVTCGRKQMS